MAVDQCGGFYRAGDINASHEAGPRRVAGSIVVERPDGSEVQAAGERSEGNNGDVLRLMATKVECYSQMSSFPAGLLLFQTPSGYASRHRRERRGEEK